MKNGSGLDVLIVDSNQDFLGSSCELIAEAGHRAWGARDLIAAANYLADQTPDLMLVELDLLELDGADPLGDLRAHAPGVPTILMAAGPPGTRFETLSRPHQVYGYHDKEHGRTGMLIWVAAAMMTAHHANMLRETKEGLRELLRAIPELHEIGSPEETLAAIFKAAGGLLGSGDGFVAARASDPVGKPVVAGLTRSLDSVDDYVVSASSAEYPQGQSVDKLDSIPQDLMRSALEEASELIDEKHGVLPLSLGEHTLGLAYLREPRSAQRDRDLLQLFASQAAAAIRNAALYEMATVDAATRVFRKSYTLERLRETIKLAWRKAFPISVLMLDIDDFRDLNAVHGHVVGDRVLRRVGRILKAKVRDSDIVGRFGGDEFLVVLIDADEDGAKLVADRIHGALSGERAWPPAHGLPPLSLSIGTATIRPGEESPFDLGSPNFQLLIDTLLGKADSAMYAARGMEGRYSAGGTLIWADFAQT